MHQKNNNNDAVRKAAESRDPYVASLARNDGRGNVRYSEAVRAVMDEMNGTSNSRQARLNGAAPH